MKDLIRLYVNLAKTFSKEAAKSLANDRLHSFDPTGRYFYQYLRERDTSRAYLHAARLLKEEMQRQSKARQRGKELALFRRAA